MTSAHRVFIWGFVSALVLSGCGDKKVGTQAAAPKAVEPPSALVELMPAGAVAIVHVPSLPALEDDIRRLVAAVDEKQAGEVAIADVIESMPGLDPSDFDLTKAASLAVTMDPSGRGPGMTAILPAKEPNTIAYRIQTRNSRAAVEVSNGVAAVTPVGSYKRGGMPPQLAGPLPEGDIVARIDVATLAKTLGPMAFAKAEEQLEALGAGAGSPGETLKPMLDWARQFVEASTTWDLAIRIEGTGVETDFLMGFSDAAPLAVFAKADLPALARMLAGEGALSFAVALDVKRAWNAMRGAMNASMEAYPPAVREQFGKALELGERSLAKLGHGFVMNADFTEAGMEMTGVFETTEPGEYVKAMAEVVGALDTKDSFFTVTRPEERTIEGMKVHGWRMKLDVAKVPDSMKQPGATDALAAMYGKDGLAYNFVPMGTRLLMVIGQDAALTRAIKAAKAPAETPLSKALVATGADTVGYARMDFRALMRQMSALMPALAGGAKPEVPAGDPVALTMVANAGPRQLRIRTSFDVGRFAALFKAMMK
jgi:hypothetical protein